MKEVDVYKQYFVGQCVYNDVERNGAVVTLTATSDSGNIMGICGCSCGRNGRDCLLGQAA